MSMKAMTIYALPLSYVPEKPVTLNRELLRYRASPLSR